MKSDYKLSTLSLVLAQVGIVVFLFLEYCNGADSYVLIHDNLDGRMALFRAMRLSGVSYWSVDSVLDNAIGGLPISSLTAGISFGELLYFWLGEFSGIVVNETVARFVAFWGMFLLLKGHFLKDDENFISVGVAFSFALLPFWPSGLLSVAGQPLLFYAFLNVLNNRKKMISWFVLCAYPFYSSLVLAGFAIILFFIVFLLWDFLKNKRVNVQGLSAIITLSVLSIVASYKLFYTTIFSNGLVSHRAHFATEIKSLADYAALGWDNFLHGQYHAASLHDRFILGALILAAIVSIIYRIWDRRLWGLVAICLVISSFYGFWGGIKTYLPQHVIIQGVQWDRLHFLHPLLWSLVFAVSLQLILSRWSKIRPAITLFVLCLLAGQAVYAYKNSNHLVEKQKSGLTFAQFYSEPLFEEVNTFIGSSQSSYRVGTIGLHPGVALYNGFYTVDGYFASYPLSYKLKFRKIIAKELDKNLRLKKYFDDWGSRCYLFVSELGTYSLFQKDTKGYIRNLELNTKQFYDLGGKYILSAIPIANAKQNNLKLVQVFEKEQSPWRIWLYHVQLSG